MALPSSFKELYVVVEYINKSNVVQGFANTTLLSSLLTTNVTNYFLPSYDYYYYRDTYNSTGAGSGNWYGLISVSNTEIRLNKVYYSDNITSYSKITVYYK